MPYTYDRSPSGDKLTLTRCDEGHLQILVTSGIGGTTVPVCVADEDAAEVIAEMRGYARLPECGCDNGPQACQCAENRAYGTCGH